MHRSRPGAPHGVTQRGETQQSSRAAQADLLHQELDSANALLVRRDASLFHRTSSGLGGAGAGVEGQQGTGGDTEQRVNTPQEGKSGEKEGDDAKDWS